MDKIRKEKIDKVTEFIVSCWDENNPNDGLTFDERIKMRIDDLPEEEKSILNMVMIE